MTAAIKSNATTDAKDGFDQLEDKHEEKSEVDESKDDEDAVCDPAAWTWTDRDLMVPVKKRSHSRVWKKIDAPPVLE
jgi:hypothetical protein